MNSISASTWAKAILGNYYVSSLLFFGLCLAALMSGSVVAIIAGLLLYVRPMLYANVVNSAINWTVTKFSSKTASSSHGTLVFAS